MQSTYITTTITELAWLQIYLRVFSATHNQNLKYKHTGWSWSGTAKRRYEQFKCHWLTHQLVPDCDIAVGWQRVWKHKCVFSLTWWLMTFYSLMWTWYLMRYITFTVLSLSVFNTFWYFFHLTYLVCWYLHLLLHVAVVAGAAVVCMRFSWFVFWHFILVFTVLLILMWIMNFINLFFQGMYLCAIDKNKGAKLKYMEEQHKFAFHFDSHTQCV